jgi:hypothetical protein
MVHSSKSSLWMSNISSFHQLLAQNAFVYTLLAQVLNSSLYSTCADILHVAK